MQDEPFAVVFAAMGVTNADATAVRERLETRATTDDLVVFLNTADDPLVERIVTPRLALTVAEHLAFERGRHVLVVMADMTSYCEAVREVAASRGEIPQARVSRLSLQRPREPLRACRADSREARLGHPDPGADDAR